MKILFVLEYYHPHIGGVEKLFADLINTLAGEGHECVILTRRFKKNLPKIEKLENVTIHRISTWGRNGFSFFAWRKASKLAKDCDLIHTTSYTAGLPAWIAAKMCRKKVIITFHEVWGELWFRLPFQSVFSKLGHYCFEQFLLLLSFDLFVAPSHSTAVSLQNAGVKKEKVKQIYPGINYAEFIPQESEISLDFAFTYFGRLGISKGLDLLLRAFATLQTEACLQLIIPKQPKRILKWIKKKIRKHRMQDRVVIRHNLPESELKEAVQASQCVVIPSYSEGFCYAAVETAALNVPLISSDQGSLPEVIGGKVIGMKAQSVDGLIAAMKSALNNEWDSLPHKIFPLQESVQNYLNLYQELK